MTSNNNTLKIELSKKDYFPGEDVKGKVLYHGALMTPIYNIVASIYGAEHTSEKKHKVIDKKEVLFGKDKEGGTPVDLANGNFSWPFSFELPKTVPPTIQAHSLSIHYTITATIHGPKKDENFHDLEVKEVSEKFTVHTINDNIPAGSGMKKKELGGSKKAVTLKITMDKGVYFPGDTLNPRIEITNTSKKAVDFFTLQVTDAWKDSGYTHLAETEEEKHDDGFPIQPQGVDGFDKSVSFVLSDEYEPTVEGHIIKHSYSLHAVAIVGGKTKVKAEAAFKVGSKPEALQGKTPKTRRRPKSMLVVDGALSESQKDGYNTVSVVRQGKTQETYVKSADGSLDV